jgi:transposase-like protein
MKKKARSYSIDFKQEAVRRMAEATTIIGLAKELGVRRKLLYQWRDQFRAVRSATAMSAVPSICPLSPPACTTHIFSPSTCTCKLWENAKWSLWSQ